MLSGKGSKNINIGKLEILLKEENADKASNVEENKILKLIRLKQISKILW